MNDKKLLIWVGAGLVGLILIAGIVMLASHITGPKNAVIGRWHLRDTTICSLTYPREIEFFPDKQYATSGFSLFWGGGQYAVVDRSRLRLETRTGVAIYDVTLSGKSLTFKNSSGCTIVYDRATP